MTNDGHESVAPLFGPPCRSQSEIIPGRLSCFSAVENEQEVEDFFVQGYLEALGAVVFDPQSFDGNQIRRDATVRYKIRLRAEQYAGTHKKANPRSFGTTTKWFTNHMFPRRPTIGPRGDEYGDPEPGYTTFRLFIHRVM